MPARSHGSPARSATIGEAEMARLLAGLLLRMAAVAFAVALISAGHDTGTREPGTEIATAAPAHELDVER